MTKEIPKKGVYSTDLNSTWKAFKAGRPQYKSSNTLCDSGNSALRGCTFFFISVYSPSQLLCLKSKNSNFIYIFTLLITGSSHCSHSPVSLQHGKSILLHCMMEKVKVCYLTSPSTPPQGTASSQAERGNIRMAQTQHVDGARPVNVSADTWMMQAVGAIHLSAHAEICRHLLTNTPLPTPPFATSDLSLNARHRCPKS